MESVQRRNRGAARGALLAATALIGIGVLVFLATRSSGGGAAPEEQGRAADTAPDGPISPLDPLVGAGDPDAGGTPGSDRRTEPEPAPVSAAFDVRAIDSTTGQPVMRFWVKRDLFVEVAASMERIPSDPATGAARLERHTPPAPLSIRAARYAQAQAMEPAPPIDSIEVTLERATSMVGVVRDGSSAPLSGVRVNLEWYGAGAEALDPQSDPQPFEGATLTRTDNDGRYAFSSLPPGVYATRTTVGGATVRSERTRVVGGTWHEVDLWLDHHTVAVVRVMTPEGLPSPRSLVLLFAEDADADEDPLARGYTDENGRVRIGPLAPLAYRTQVVSDAGTAPETRLNIESTSPSELDLEIQLNEK